MTVSDEDTAAVSADLLKPQSSADRLPAFLATGPQVLGGILTDSAQFLGSKDGSKFWLAQNTMGEFCLIALLPGSAQLTGSTCASSDLITREGLTLQIASPTLEQRIRLLPEGYVPADGEGDLVGSQLLVTDSAVAVGPLEATSSSGQDIELPSAPSLTYEVQ